MLQPEQITLRIGRNVLEVEEDQLREMFYYLSGPYEIGGYFFNRNGNRLFLPDVFARKMRRKYKSSEIMKKQINKLEESGWRLVCHVHNHYMGSPLPSLTDMDNYAFQQGTPFGLVRKFPLIDDFRVFETKEYGDRDYFGILSTIRVVDRDIDTSRVVRYRKTGGLKYFPLQETTIRIPFSEYIIRTASFWS